MDLKYKIIGPPDHSAVVCHRPGDLPMLLAEDWSRFGRLGEKIMIRVVAEGYTDRNVQFWTEEEWPFSMRLRREDFADERGRVFVHEFEPRIKPTRFTLPRLSDDMLGELGPITDYLLTYDFDSSEFGLRLRQITKEQQPFWFMAKLARG